MPSKYRKRRKDILENHRHWLAQAEHAALGSPHPSVKVGAVLIDRKGRKIASGSNRFAYGVDRRRRERYREGSKSLWINCAEQIVIAEALRKRANIKGASLYLTLEPCAVCAGLIGELRIPKVFVPVGALRRYARLKSKWKTSIETGLIKLAESGTRLVTIDTKPRMARTVKRKKTRR